MKKLKKEQIGPWCSYCNVKTRAIYRTQYWALNKFCCEEHKEYLEKDEQHSDFTSEADEQTWLRL